MEPAGIAIAETSRTLYILNTEEAEITSVSIGQGSSLPVGEILFLAVDEFAEYLDLDEEER